MWRFAGWLGVGACLSMDGAKDRWLAWVADHDDCEVADDCVVVYTECPLGCWSAVNAEYEAEAQREADDLVQAYERGGRACAYDCLAAGPAACTDGRCTASGATDSSLTDP